MKEVAFQILTIGSLFLFTIYECILMKSNKMKEDNGKIVWNISSERIGVARRDFWKLIRGDRSLEANISLSEGCYILGNRWGDEIYIDSSGKRVKIYFNVQKEKIYLTVLKGRISINNHIYDANKSSRIRIMEYTRIKIQDIRVQFQRRSRN